MTLRAMRYQAPLASSAGANGTPRWLRRPRMRSALTRGPSTASSAGMTVSAASMSTATVATPP